MANPSYAGGEKNDPTIHSLMRLMEPDFAGFTVVNWEPFIATNPDDLHAWRAKYCGTAEYDSIEESSLSMIRNMTADAVQRFVAYGNLVPFVGHTQRVLMALSHDGEFPLYAFGVTNNGSPLHPMARGRNRIKDGTVPIIWREGRNGTV